MIQLFWNNSHFFLSTYCEFKNLLYVYTIATERYQKQPQDEEAIHTHRKCILLDCNNGNRCHRHHNIDVDIRIGRIHICIKEKIRNDAPNQTQQHRRHKIHLLWQNMILQKEWEPS